MNLTQPTTVKPTAPPTTAKACADQAAAMIALAEDKARIGAGKSVAAALSIARELRQLGQFYAGQEKVWLEHEAAVGG